MSQHIRQAALALLAKLDIDGEDISAEVQELREALANTTEEWREGAPPKRGIYQVKRVGKASSNHGFSYWNGKHWGNLCARRAYAQEIKDMGRKTPSRYPMLWLKKGGAA